LDAQRALYSANPTPINHQGQRHKRMA